MLQTYRAVLAPIPLPMLVRSVSAGFLSPADDFIEDQIDLTRLLISNRPATFLVRVRGQSMIDVQLCDGDLAIVDRSLNPRNGDVVVVDVAPTRKGCAVTRSFSSRVRELDRLEQAVATYAARLGEKLRLQNLGTDHVTVFIHTSEHDRDEPQRSTSITVDLPEATSDTVILTKAARWGARRIWREEFAYSKAGLITDDLVLLPRSQRAFAGVGQFDREHSSALMGALDNCNKRWGRGTIQLASAGYAKARTWSTKFEMKSPSYTTIFEELPRMR